MTPRNPTDQELFEWGADNGHTFMQSELSELRSLFYKNETAEASAAQEIGKIIMRELDIGGGDYLQSRLKVAGLSGLPVMAVAYDGHIDKIRETMASMIKVLRWSRKRIEYLGFINTSPTHGWANEKDYFPAIDDLLNKNKHIEVTE